MDLSASSVGWGDLCLTIERRAPVCHAEPAAGSSRFAHHDQWLPSLLWQPLRADEATAELARRYLATYGPASDEDLAHWAGVSRTKARRWIARLGDEVVEIDVDGDPMWLRKADLASLADQQSRPTVHWARLLGKYDPLLLAHRNKDWLVNPDKRRTVWRSGGRVEAVVLADRRIVGTWRYQRRRRTIDLTYAMFNPPPRWLTATLDTEAQRIAHHFDLEPGEVTITTEESP